jgi:glycosyltransferase involved in cell wall biosynthesis
VPTPECASKGGAERQGHLQVPFEVSRPLVVHVTPTYPPVLGGTERFVQRLTEIRRSAGLPVRVLTSTIGLPAKPRRAASEPDVLRLPGFSVAHTPVIPRLPLALAKVERDAVIHLHIAHAFTPEVVAVVCRLRRMPYVAHLHLDAPPSGFLGPLLRLYKPAVLAAVLRSATAVVVFTNAQADEVAVAYRVEHHRIYVVPNGVDRQLVIPVPRERPTEIARLLFVGRLGPTKNLEVLLDALAELPGPSLDIVGDGPLRQRLERQAERLAPGRVMFHGTLEGEALLARYRAADVFVLPSSREGMPLALLEAMASGLPAVATDISGIRELVVPGVTGELVPVNDVSGLRAAIDRLVADPRRREAMGRAALEAVRSHTWESAAEACERIYAKVPTSVNHSAPE